MPSVAIFSLATRGPGVFSAVASLPANVPFGSLGCSLLRDNWPDNGSAVCAATVELSQDSGGTWTPLVGASFSGGVPTGVNSTVGRVLGLAKGAGRQARIHFFLNVALSFSANVEFT